MQIIQLLSKFKMEHAQTGVIAVGNIGSYCHT